MDLRRHHGVPDIGPAFFELVDRETDFDAFAHAKVMLAELASKEEDKIAEYEIQVDYEGGATHFTAPRFLALLEFGLLHLLGTPAEECAAFLSAVDACLAETPGEWNELVVEKPLDPAHRPAAERLLRALDAEEAFDGLMHLCGMLGCIQGERNPECPYIEPELLHIGLTVVTAPADRAPPSSSALLFLSCPPDEAVALPLIYLLRAKLSADPAFAAYRVEVLPPDVELTLEQELQTFQQARSSHWAAEGELDRYPASCRTDLSNLLQWLHGRVAWEFRRLLHTSTAQLEAAGLPAPQHACLPSPPSRLQADVKRPFVTAEMQWRIASGRNRAAEDVVRVVKGAVDRKETLEEPRVPGLSLPEWRLELERFLHLEHLWREGRRNWWKAHCLPSAERCRQFTVTFRLRPRQSCECLVTPVPGASEAEEEEEEEEGEAGGALLQ